MAGQAAVGERVLGALLNGARLLTCQLQLQGLLVRSLPESSEGESSFGGCMPSGSSAPDMESCERFRLAEPSRERSAGEG